MTTAIERRIAAVEAEVDRLAPRPSAYDEFIKQSECKAYKVGKACREGKVGAATGTDKAQLEAGIKRDKDQLKSLGCE